MSSCKGLRFILTLTLALGWVFTCLGAHDDGQDSVHRDQSYISIYVSIDDLDKFRPGRPKNELLHDLQWRGFGVEAVVWEGKHVMEIAYVFYADPKELQRHKSYTALFVDGKFEKFVRSDSEIWKPGDKMFKVGECSPWLARLMKSPAVSNDVIRKEVMASPAPRKQGPSMCSTLAWLFGASRSPREKREPTAADYQRNAALRHQFTAARLDLGMTEQEVERVLQAKPIESGALKAGTCKVYGSSEVFPILNHFSNVAVIFRNGKAIMIRQVAAGESGQYQAPKGWIDNYREWDAMEGMTYDQMKSRK